MRTRSKTRFSRFMPAVSAALVLLALARPAAAEEPGSCPALPGAHATFAAAATSLMDKFFGSGSDRMRPSTWTALDSEQKKEVLDTFVKELAGTRAKLADERAAAAAKRKLDDLRRRIFVRDKLERDPRITAQRELDRTQQGKAVPYTRDPKSLKDIIAEETAKVQPSLAATYASAYSTAIGRAILEDPKTFLTTAGELAGGDYKAVRQQAAKWGAQAFGRIVGDVLGELGHTDTQVIWQGAVARADVAKTIMQELARGNHDGAWEAIKTQYKKEVKDKAISVSKGVLNWVLDPNPSLRKTLGFSAGDLYFKVLEAEAAFIKANVTAFRDSDLSDGKCIRLYNSTYDRLKDKESAYTEFHSCLGTSRGSAFFEFENNATKLGMDLGAAQRAYLEDQRTGRAPMTSPSKWMAEKLKAGLKQQQAALKAQMLPELSAAEKVMANLANAAARAASNRLTELAAEALNQRQWDGLEKRVREIEAVLDKTLAAVKGDIDRLKKNSKGIQAACKAFKEQRKIARRAYETGRELSVAASRLREGLKAVDVSACIPPGQTPKQPIDVKAIQGEIEQARADMAPRLENVCAAPDDLRTAETKQEARARLDDALAEARQAGTDASTLEAAAAKLGKGEKADGENSESNNAAEDLAALKQELEKLDADLTALRGEFRPALKAMNRARVRMNALVPVNKDLTRKVKECLRPLTDAPVARKPRDIIERLSGSLADDQICAEDADKAWMVSDYDEMDTSETRATSAWRYRDVEPLISVDTLRATLADLEARCGAADTETADDAGEIDVDELRAEATASRSRLDQCVAQSITAFHETWIKEDKDQEQACAEARRQLSAAQTDLKQGKIAAAKGRIAAAKAADCDDIADAIAAAESAAEVAAQKQLSPRVKKAGKTAEKLEALAAKTESQAGEAVALCQAGDTELASTRAGAEQLVAVARALRAKGERWQELAERVAATAASVKPLGKRAAKSAGKVGNDRKQAEKYALKACEAMQRIRSAKSEPRRRKLLGKVRAALGDAEARLTSAGENTRTARDAAGQAAAAAEALPPVTEDPSQLSAQADALKERQKALGKGVKQAAADAKKAAKLTDRLGKSPERAAKLKAEGEAALQPVAEYPAAADLLARIGAAFGRVEAAAGRPGDCAGKLESAAAEVQRQVAALKEEVRDAVKAAGKAASAKPGKRLAEIEDRVADARAAADSAEVFHEAAGSVVAQARQCLVLAGDLIEQAERRRADDMASARRDCPRRMPGSEARWDDDANKPVCECPSDKVRTKDKSQCVNEADFTRWARDQCPRKFPNSVLKKADPRGGEYRCKCPSGFLWNQDNSACVDEARFVAKVRGLCARKYPNSELVEYDARTGDYSCNCLDGWIWKSDRSQCLDVADFNRRAAAACARDTANATLRESDPSNGRYDCRCRQGYAWDGQRCIDANVVVQAAQRDCSRQYPGSVVVNVTSVNPLQAQCNCPAGTTWNANGSGCVVVRGPSAQDVQQTIQGIQAIIEAITGGGRGGGGGGGGKCHRRADGKVHCGGG